MKSLCTIKLFCCILAICSCSAMAGLSDIKIENGDFEKGGDENGIPMNWQPYGKQLPPASENYCYAMVKKDTNKNNALFVMDNNAAEETGVCMTIPAKCKGDYVLSLDAKTDSLENGSGCYMQIRFLPSQKYVYKEIAPGIGQYQVSELSGTAPDGTTGITIFLYTHGQPKPKIIIDNVKLGNGAAVDEVKSFKRNLYLETDIVKDGKSALALIVPAGGEFNALAGEIVATVKSKTGVELKVIKDDGPADASQLTGNLLLLGNRSDNRYISSLYDRHYCIIDRCYPGEGGSVVRTLHNPFGDGHNVIFAGGSDREGTAQAVKILIDKINAQKYADTRLQIGRLAEIKLGKGIKVPENIKQAYLLEACRGYGSEGYFGWNSLSKNMALYYLTGDEKFAREFLRLAFPDEKALKYLDEVDKEMIEVKNDPLAGPYHYGAIMMILYWDLIEESPVFTDADREKVTAAFSRQIDYWKKGAYRIFSYDQPAAKVGDRHAQWEALSLFGLCRYLDRHYSTRTTAQGLRAVKNFFAPLNSEGHVIGESGSLFWYPTSIEPVFYYVLLSGSRNAATDKVLQKLAEGQTMLFNGRDDDWAMSYASNELMLKMAYLLDDQAYLRVAQQAGFKPGRLMMGQSFYPDKPYRSDSMLEQAGKWNFFHPVNEELSKGSDPEKLFAFGNYRSESGGMGDYILLDGSYEWGRNLYHCLALIELRIGGIPLLAGHHNQVYLYKDGMYAAKFPKFSEIAKAKNIGRLACFDGKISDYNGHMLDRTLLLEQNRYMVFADTVTAINPGKTTDIELMWEFAAGISSWMKNGSEIELVGRKESKVPAIWELTAAEIQPMIANADTRTSYMAAYQTLLIRNKGKGDRCRVDFNTGKDYSGNLVLHLLGHDSRARIQVILDGKIVADDFKHYESGIINQQLPLGKQEFKSGKHTLEFVVKDSSELLADSFLIGFIKLGIYGQPAGKAETVSYRLSNGGIFKSGLLRFNGDSYYKTTGSCAKMSVSQVFAKDESKTFFTVLAPSGNNAGVISAPYRSGLVARLPETVIIQKTGAGTVTILAEKYLSAVNFISLAGLGKADYPVDMHWDFSSGKLTMNCDRDTVAEFELIQSDKAVSLDMKDIERNGNTIRLKLKKGSSSLDGAYPSANFLAGIKMELGQAEKGLTAANGIKVPDKSQEQNRVPTLALSWKTSGSGSAVSSICAFPFKDGAFAAAAGNILMLIEPDGKKQEIKLNEQIGALHWWSSKQLLLTGCRDEKVTAWGLDRQQKWEFTSIMAPEVYKTAKYYWYKSTSAYPGVWSISSGVFLNGEEQAFIGSACTLEILDGNGKLIKRIAEYWGPLSMFALVPQADGSTLLTAGMAFSGNPEYGVINNRRPDTVNYIFKILPPESDEVRGWTIINNTAILCEDLNGDGKKEVVATQNGSWNRILIYDAAGYPLCQASLGPGEKPGLNYPSRKASVIANINDIAVADLNGDGKKQIVSALSRKVVLCFDHQCRNQWSLPLDSEPVLLKAVAADGKKQGYLIVACRNGDILKLSSDGKIIGQAKTPSCPTALMLTNDSILAGTEKGEIYAFKL